MKIRLTVTAPNGQSRTFDHPGPSVRIGRDPDFELCLAGPEADLCSTRHARIDLSPDGATLTDTGSTNHTLHNDAEITADTPVPLKAGDRVQIGYSGAKLLVLSLDLSPGKPPPRLPAGKATAGPARWLLLGGAAVAAGLLLGVTLLFVMKKTPLPKDEPGPTLVATLKDKDKGKAGNKDEGKKADDEDGGKGKGADAPPREAVAVKVGNYLRQPDLHPSVLVQRDPITQRWSVMSSGQEVLTGRTLVSLPGYKSVLHLDTGVKVNLWGNLPELWPDLPVRESIVMFQPPPDGFDAELILDRGRVELECLSQAKRSAVRVKMSGETWDVTLDGKGCKVCIDHVFNVREGATGPATRLFSDGKVAVKTARGEASLGKNGYLAWASWAPDTLYQEKLDKAPQWWTGNPKVEGRTLFTAVFLKDWATLRFDKAPLEVLQTITAGLKDGSKELAERKLGLWFLAALDEIGPLVERGLNDQTAEGTAEMRGVAQSCLQEWLANNESRRVALLRILKGLLVPDETAKIIVRLLSPLPDQELSDPATYQQLIDYLNHPDVAVRHLANWHLYIDLVIRKRLPAPRKDLDYEPTMPEEKRKQVIERWRKLVPPGQVPGRR